MEKNIVFFMDDDGNEVPKEQATKLNIVEFDENGNRIRETFMVKVPETYDEDVKAPWDDIEIDPESDILKNAVYYDEDSKSEDSEDFEELVEVQKNR